MSARQRGLAVAGRAQEADGELVALLHAHPEHELAARALRGLRGALRAKERANSAYGAGQDEQATNTQNRAHP